MVLEEFLGDCRCQGTSTESAPSSGSVCRGRSRERAVGSEDVDVVGEISLSVVVVFTCVVGAVEGFLEGRPLFLPSEDSVSGLDGTVVFFSFGGLPLLLGSASLTGEFVRTGFSRVIEMLSFVSPS